jgi:predicted cupin superfamily sugar epimerase
MMTIGKESSLNRNADYWIKKLQLKEHPEGGYFRETYRSDDMLEAHQLPERYQEAHSFSTGIYYLLKGKQFSAFHRLKSDEVWHFYTGSSLAIHIISEKGEYAQIELGDNFEKGEVFQKVIPAGNWFGATVDDDSSYTLVGCTIAPGFDFSDFELGARNKLIKRFPEHEATIKKLTR